MNISHIFPENNNGKITDSHGTLYHIINEWY